MNLIKILSLVTQNGGVTYNLVTGELNPKYGYMVAKQGYEKLIPEPLWDSILGKTLLAEYVNSHSSLLSDPSHYLGVWFDGANYVLDISQLFEEKRNAIFFGIARKQKAIWDNSKQKEIKILWHHNG